MGELSFMLAKIGVWISPRIIGLQEWLELFEGVKMIGEVCPCFLISDCLILSSQQVSSSDIANTELVIVPS
jgi:hypothetical protein